MRQPRTYSIPQLQTHRRLKDRETQTRAAHHGTVEVSSSADSGASFVIYLPAQPAPIATDEELKEVAS